MENPAKSLLDLVPRGLAVPESREGERGGIFS